MKSAGWILIVIIAICGLGYASAASSRISLASYEKNVVQREIDSMYAEYKSADSRAHARMPPPASITWLTERDVTNPSRSPVPPLADGVLVKRPPAYWPSKPVALPWAYVFSRGTTIPFVNKVYVGWQLGGLMGEGDERWFVCLPGWQFEVRRIPLWYF